MHLKWGKKCSSLPELRFPVLSLEHLSDGRLSTLSLQRMTITLVTLQFAGRSQANDH